MPLHVYKKLGIEEIKHVTMSFQMADRSVKRPRGILKDVLVKVITFIIFLANFVVLDTEEDDNILLILRRPFRATSHALIDVKKKKS